MKDNYNNDYGHSESSDGKVVSGSYRVLLPDGRTQIVSYKDEGYGFVASVKYEGTARYPEYTKPTYSAPAYKASPPPPANYQAQPAAQAPYKAPAPAAPQQQYKAAPAKVEKY